MKIRNLALLFISLALAACAGLGPRHYASAKNDAPPPKDQAYRIGVDDKVQVVVWRNPDLSVTVPVRPDGKISVPLIGDVLASGVTPMEVASTIKNKLSYYIRDPNVSVLVTEMQSHEFQSRVRVTGAVRTPQSIPYRPGMTVLDAILQAGGVNDFAAPNGAVVHRRTKNGVDNISVRLGTILAKGGIDSNIELRPGDIVTVPERLF
jgi:polysaccharide export outer membrane protein